MKKSSQIFIDPCCNVLNINENVPKYVIDNYIHNFNLKCDSKYKNNVFYKLQNKIRNYEKLTDSDLLYLYSLDEDAKMKLIQISNQVILNLINLYVTES
jgi:hypothetical protein